VALFGCALLSKSMAVSLPAVLLILEVYPLRRLGGSIGWWTKPARRIYLEKVPFVLLAGVASAVAFKGQAVVHNMASLTLLPMSHRLAVSAYGLAFYLLKTIVPSSLSPLYELPFTVNPGEIRFILSYAAILALTAIALALRHRVPGIAAAWLAYVVCLLPVLGIFQNGPQIAADRYTYLAGLGWAILAGGGIVFCCRSSIRSGLVVGSLAMCIVAASAVLTWKQVQVWHDSELLWTYALSIDPNSSVARNNLGHELIRQSRLGDALRHFEQSLRTQQGKSADAEAHNNWGLALLGQGKPTSAIEQFQQALRIAPNLVAAHSNWGTALIQQGKPAEAIAHFQIALAIQPDLADTHINWGAALLQQGRPAEAIEHFRQAARIEPHHAPAHTNWGAALLQLGKRTEAIEHFQQALRIERDLAETR
jgi:Tfp pilus assembly protein PilF